MALIKCPECGREVSDKAASCIHCGYPLEKPQYTVKIKLPVDKDLFWRVEYNIEDENGNVLASGVSGQIVSFEANKPMSIMCKPQKHIGKRWQFPPIQYSPHENARFVAKRYQNIREDKVELQEVDHIEGEM